MSQHRTYDSKCAGRGHLRRRAGREQPRGYEKRVPSVLIDDGTSGTRWISGGGVTESTGAITDPDGVSRTRVRFSAASAATAFMIWESAAAFNIPKWALGIEVDIWAATPGFASLASVGLSLDVRVQNTAASQVLNCSAMKLAPGWNPVFLPKEAFTTTAGTVTWADATDLNRILLRAASVTGHNHDFYIGPLRWAGRSRGQLCIMFDDNRESAYTNGFPIMRDRGLVGTMFSNSDFLAGGTIDGLARMTGAQLLEMKQAGWEVCNHGKDHASGYGAAAVAVSQAQIEDGYTGNGTLLGWPNVYASPFGDFSNDYWTAAANAGVDGFRGLWQSGLEVAGASDMWLDQRKTIPAFTVASTTTPAQILAVIDGVTAAGGTCNVLFHGIEASGGEFYSVANFTTVMDGIVAASRRNNYDVVTMSKAFMRTGM